MISYQDWKKGKRETKPESAEGFISYADWKKRTGTTKASVDTSKLKERVGWDSDDYQKQKEKEADTSAALQSYADKYNQFASGISAQRDDPRYSARQKYSARQYQSNEQYKNTMDVQEAIAKILASEEKKVNTVAEKSGSAADPAVLNTLSAVNSNMANLKTARQKERERYTQFNTLDEKSKFDEEASKAKFDDYMIAAERLKGMSRKKEAAAPSNRMLNEDGVGETSNMDRPAYARTNALGAGGTENKWARKAVASGLIGAGAGYMGAGATALDVDNVYRQAKKQPTHIDEERYSKTPEQELADNLENAHQFKQSYDYLSRLSEKKSEEAKAGGGNIRGALVDVGATGTQMLTDAAAGALTGGSALVPMAIRVFGQSSQEARGKGASLGQSVAYGAASAAVELITEKMFDGLAGIYGKGVADDMVKGVVQKLTSRPAGQAALMFASDMLGEGLEEVLSGIADPLIKTIYNGQSVAESYDKNMDWSETLYEGLIGAVLGGLGGTVELSKNYADAENFVVGKSIDDYYETAKQNGLYSKEAMGALSIAEGNIAKHAHIENDSLLMTVSKKDDEEKPAIAQKSAEENIQMAAQRAAQKANVPVAQPEPVTIRNAMPQNDTEPASTGNNIPLRSETQVSLLDRSRGMDKATRDEYLNAYNQGQDVDSYSEGFLYAENAARNGATFDAVKQATEAAGLTTNQLKAAYNSGMSLMKQKTEAFTSSLKAGVNRMYTDGAIMETAERLTRSGDAKYRKAGVKKTARLLHQQLQVVDGMGKNWGINIVVQDRIDVSDGTTIKISGANGAYDPNTNTVYISLDSIEGAYMFTAVHELTHYIKNWNEAGYDALEAMVSEKLGKDVFDTRAKEYMEKHGVDENVAREEIVADTIPAILTDEKIVKDLVRTNRTLAEKIHDFIKEFLDALSDIMDRVMLNHDKAEMLLLKDSSETLRAMYKLFDESLSAASEIAESANSQRDSVDNEGEKKLSVEYDVENRPVAIISEDILDGVPREDWVSRVKGVLRNKFPDGVSAGKSIIKIDRTTRRESTFSKYMQWAFINDKAAYTDKLRAMNNADDIIKASVDYIGEALKHPRNDDIIEFARGNALIRVGKNDYSASVIVGTEKDNSLVLYDIIDLKPTKIEIKKEGAHTDHRQVESGRSRAPEDNIPQGELSVKNSLRDNDGENTAYTQMRGSESPSMKFSRVNDKKTLDFLNKQETLTVYRAMQVIDGKLYPPMAARVKDDTGKKALVDNSTLDTWEQADERPDLIKNGKFNLDKANGSSLDAAYNPYFHTSLSMLNDQFSSAVNRDNLVVVEGVIPKSELTSGYKAQYAKDAVGMMKWHSGPVSSKLKGAKARRVVLSRWFKPVRIIPDSEVAVSIAKLLEGENLSIPRNTVTPSLAAELEKQGVKIEGSNGNVLYSTKDSDGNDLTAEQAEYFSNSKVLDGNGNLLVVYHGGTIENVFDTTRGNGETQYGQGSYFTTGKQYAKEWVENKGGAVKAYYLNIERMFDDRGEIEKNDNRDALEKILRDEGFTDKDIRFAWEWGARGINSVLLRTKGRTEPKLFSAYADRVNEMIRQAGYDGIVGGFYDGEQYVVFSPEQAKLVSNKAPTTNADIRFSSKDDLPSINTEELRDTMDYDEQTSIVSDAAAIVDGFRAKDALIDRIADKVLRETMSTYDKDKLKGILREVLDNISNATDDAVAYLTSAAKDVLLKSSEINVELSVRNKAIRKLVRDAKIRLTDVQKKNIEYAYGSYNNYRKAHGLFNVTDKGMPLDQLWGAWNEQYPDVFSDDVGEGDMPFALREILSTYQDHYENPFGFGMDEAASDVAMRILEQYFTSQATEHFAGDKADELKALMNKYDKKIKSIREQSRKRADARIAKIKEANREKLNLISREYAKAKKEQKQADRAKFLEEYRKLTDKKNQQLSAQKERFNEWKRGDRAKRESKQEADKLKARITTKAKDLRTMLIAPKLKEGKYVPDFLREPVLDILSGIDFTGVRGGMAAQGKWYASMQHLYTEYENYIKAHSNDSKIQGTVADADKYMSTQLMIHDAFLPIFNELLESIKGKGDINKLNNAELQQLDVVLSSVYANIRDVNRLYRNKRFAEASNAADTVISYADTVRESKDWKYLNGAKRFLEIDMLDSFSYGLRLGAAGESIIDALSGGLEKSYTRVREANEFFEKLKKDLRVKDSEIHGWTREAKRITLDSGKTVNMSAAQMMEIYALNNREQARLHMYKGGIEIADIDTGTKKIQQKESFAVTPADVAKIIGMLSSKQRLLIDGMQDYMSTTVAGWGNETTQELYMIDMYRESKYWTIRASRNSIDAQKPEEMRTFNAVMNSSFTKPTNRYASNPIMIGDAFQTFGDHISGMAVYNGLALPIDDAMKWINYRQKDENGATLRNGNTKLAIDKVLGGSGVQYLLNLITDLNGLNKSGYSTQISNKLLSNFKKASVAGKLRVVVQQPVSIFRALSEIDAKYLLAATLHKHSVTEMREHSPIAWWKSQGNYEIGTGRSLRSVIIGDDTAYQKFVNYAMKPAGAADDITWSHIWEAVKLEVRAKNKDLAGDAYMSRVAERFAEIVNKTQVVDTIMHRSQAMRSQDVAIKQTTAFMSEPTKTYNMLVNAAYGVATAQKGDKAVALKKLARTCAAWVLTEAAHSAILALHDAFRDRDDEEKFLDQWLASFVKNLKGNMNILDYIPYLRTIGSLIDGYDATNMETEAFAEIVDAATAWVNFFEGDGKKTPYGLISATIKAASDLAGSPFGGLLASAEAVINGIAPGTLKKKKLPNEENTV